MVLFGSQARGDADADIDVLVVLKGQVNPGEEIKRTSQVVADLSLQYDEVISRLFMDEHQFTHRIGISSELDGDSTTQSLTRSAINEIITFA